MFLEQKRWGSDKIENSAFIKNKTKQAEWVFLRKQLKVLKGNLVENLRVKNRLASLPRKGTDILGLNNLLVFYLHSYLIFPPRSPCDVSLPAS